MNSKNFGITVLLSPSSLELFIVEVSMAGLEFLRSCLRQNENNF